MGSSIFAWMPYSSKGPENWGRAGSAFSGTLRTRGGFTVPHRPSWTVFWFPKYEF